MNQLTVDAARAVAAGWAAIHRAVPNPDPRQRGRVLVPIGHAEVAAAIDAGVQFDLYDPPSLRVETVDEVFVLVPHV